MPAYDYRCTACSTTFEVVHKAGESTGLSCPECGSATKRVFTPVGVHFKGSGFHNTDYRSEPAQDKTVQDKPAATPAPCGADKSTSACASCPASAD
ncbi:FmdB family transcriptional regulator [bacterium]|nr:FmdB family transcriptional regulator [bacterium]